MEPDRQFFHPPADLSPPRLTALEGESRNAMTTKENDIFEREPCDFYAIIFLSHRLNTL